MAFLLRQSCQIAGAFGNPAGGQSWLTMNFPQPILLGSCIVVCMSVFGPAHGNNNAYVGPTHIPPGGPIHPSGGGQDIGTDVTTPTPSSCDILWLYVTATEEGSTQVQCAVGDITNTNYGGCWAGEFTEFDDSGYGYYYGIDASYGWSGVGQNVDLARSNGSNYNYTPECGIWAFSGNSGASVVSHNLNLDGYVTDGSHVFMAVQTAYSNVTGKQTATFDMSASQDYVGANLTFKTLIYPSSGPPAGSLGLLGVGR